MPLLSDTNVSPGSLAVVGLGPMGTAVAGALSALDPGLRVWNRSPERAAPLVARGLRRAGSAEAAIAAADVSFLCLRDYDVTRQVLERCDLEALAGRTVVQLSTGRPAEARDLARWLRDRGADCLDASILCYPHEIGSDEGVVLYAGEEQVFGRLRGALAALGADPVFCGADAGAAAVQGQAALLVLYGASLAFLQAAAIVASEDASTEAFVAVCDRAAAMMPRLLRETGELIRGPEGEDVGAFPATDVTALAQISASSRAAGISSRLSDAMLGVMEDAVRLGDRRESMAVAYEVIRGGTDKRS